MSVQPEISLQPPLISFDLGQVRSQLRNALANKPATSSPHQRPQISNSVEQVSGEPQPSQALVLVTDPRALVRTQQTALPPACTVKFRPVAPVKLRPLKTVMYRVVVSSLRAGTANNFEFEIPSDLPRVINGATLKAMLGAGRRDVLLRRVGDRWEPCPDAHPIDLTNAAAVFRIGRVQVFS